ncbi:MAG: sulfurtransferase [Thiomonas sp.]
MKLKHLIGATIIAVATAHTAGAVTLPGPLVTPQWLNEHKNEVVIVDIRDEPKTLTEEPKFEVDKKTNKKDLVKVGGYIPGTTVFVDFGKIREDKVINGVKIKAQLPSADFFTKAMDNAGLNKIDKPVVIVPEGNSVDSMDMATRLYFQLRYFGEPRDKLAILNGGVAAWLQAGLPVSTDKPAPAKGNWVAGPEDKAILASLEQVKEGLQSGKEQFVDARPTAQFLGIVKKPVNKTAGHLPGARSFPTDAIVKPVGLAHEFMSADDYKKIYAEFNIQPDAPTVTYCNTGHLASGAWFVTHEILGNKNSKLYAGSMIEWTNLGNPTVGLPQ